MDSFRQSYIVDLTFDREGDLDADSKDQISAAPFGLDKPTVDRLSLPSSMDAALLKISPELFLVVLDSVVAHDPIKSRKALIHELEHIVRRLRDEIPDQRYRNPKSGF